MALSLRYSGHQHRYSTYWNCEEVFKKERETVAFSGKHNVNGDVFQTHKGCSVLGKMQKFVKSARPEKKNLSAANNYDKVFFQIFMLILAKDFRQ